MRAGARTVVPRRQAAREGATMKLGPWQIRPIKRQLGVLRIVLIGLMLVGGGLVGLGATVLVDNQRFVAKAAGATGVVLYLREEVRRERVGSGSNERDEDVSYFYPIVQFHTAREQVVEFEGNDGSLRAGDSVKVLYDPANPHDARLDSWPSRWGAGTVPLAIGLALIAIGAVLYRLLRLLRPAGVGGSTEVQQNQHRLPARLFGGRRRRRARHNGNQGPEGGPGPTPAR